MKDMNVNVNVNVFKNIVKNTKNFQMTFWFFDFFDIMMFGTIDSILSQAKNMIHIQRFGSSVQLLKHIFSLFCAINFN